jgi:ATP-dependent helicase Lhr and Lhr-like helicase
MPSRIPAALRPFHPIVRSWFGEALGKPSLPQERGWPTIAKGDHTLILAPTGTGKTLTAFLWELNALIVEGSTAPLANAVHILYISPLKALNNDIQRNLERPLEELRQRFADADTPFPEIRVAVRTGDTPSSARARMIRKSPHILITTPESLHIMLTSVRGRGMFSGVRAVIVDEIHAVAGTKRGAHLALTLERLERVCERPPQRIGLSATQKPLEEIARFLVGSSRQCTIVDCGLVKQLELKIESPVDDLAHVAGTVWPMITAQVLRHVRASRTTIVFVNNRGQAEKMAARLNALAGEEIALPYHGSLSRERRFTLERALKAGSLRALVSTSALELGIDIGSVDLVIQLQSPKRVATGLQRVGRAGHSLAAVSRGVFAPTFRDDGLELLAIVRAMLDGDVEPTRVVQNALDVLAQIVVATVSIDDDWTSAALFDLVRQSYPYHALGRAAFDEVLEMLSGKYPSDVIAELDARIVWDRSSDMLSAPRGSRMVAVISGGTIPDRGYYTVNLPDRTRLGELDEEFVHETRVGDVFQLGSSTWRVQTIEHDRVIVTPAPGAPARMPFWHGEFAARSAHLSTRVGTLRRELTVARTRDDLETLRDRYQCDEATIRSLAEYVHEQRASTRVVPDDRTVIAEQFRDETGAVRVVLHAPFGGRVNAPWGMALAQRVRDWLGKQEQGLLARRAAVDVQVQTTDDGIMLRLPNLSSALPDGVLRDLAYPEAERLVLEEVGASSLFGARFRMNAARALLLPRGNARRRMPLWLQRLKAQDLLEVVREHPSFPILVETYRDVLQDAFDMPALARVLGDFANGEITMRSVATEIPSPFAASLQFGFVMDWMYADDTPRAEQRAAMLSLDRALLDELMGGTGADESTIAVLDELLARRRGTAAGRRARTADELTLLLDRAGDLSIDELRERVATIEEGCRGDPIAEVLDAGRAIAIPIPGGDGHDWRVVLTETFPRYAAAFGVDALARVRTGARLAERDTSDAVPAPLRLPSLTENAGRREILSRWLALAGVFSIEDVRRRYDFPEEWVETRLDEWTRGGRLVRGTFGGTATPQRWCLRRLLEQARRRELALARKQIEAVEMPAFVYFLQRWQHLHPDTRLEDEDGTMEVIRQLYGMARPAERWERDYLAPRVERYRGDAITRLATGGEMVWVGAGSEDDGVVDALTSLRFVRRGTGRAWLPDQRPLTLSADAQRVRAVLAEEGASFFEDLASATSLGPRALRDALRELVAAGDITCDTADSMRAVTRWRPLVSPKIKNQPDPTRWLPADFVAQRPVVQRRPNLRRLPKWKRPDKEGAEAQSWPGRWSLVRTTRILGAEQDESALAEQVARQWLARYGVVSRDWWRREHPAVPWRSVYRELKRLEFRGDVRRGYFVRGLAGAQFALPDAVNMLREAIPNDAPVIVMSAGDPANAYALPPAPGTAPEDRDPLTRRRSRGTLYVTRGGVVLFAVESRGRRVTVRPDASADDVTESARALIPYLTRGAGTRRDPTIETIDGASAMASPHTAAFVAAGFRIVSGGLRFYASLSER